ncbi:ATP-binding protein [Nocardioides jishulii]|uniref:ATP-binding protein n=1 Tax=Nocardioides jishulii TaxID=2575440 RepID=A0A4U2YTL9_9ACTN|nr:ATP-binding protein [Nocardioides jishulii]QCX28280.1 ATP-binding protein [Nocardioides jishulii]TKI64827.1 ATP-binding protein [Nocardioides jishulii]
MSARVIVLAGPSGSGKSRLAARLGLPVLRLDDYYKAQDAPDLPLLTKGANAGMVDWDDPRTWRLDDAVAGIAELCTVGRTDVPVYSIPESRPVGRQHLDIGEHPYFVAEGIFAAEVVEQCERRGLLARAYCVRQHPLVTFWRRLTRDLQEHRKPPLVLVRRGLALLRDQRRVVEDATSKGCLPIHPDEAYREIRDLVEAGVQER